MVNIRCSSMIEENLRSLTIHVSFFTHYSHKTQDDKHKTLVSFDYKDQYTSQAPVIDDNSTFVPPSATMTGRSELWSCSTLWYGTIVKADKTVVRVASSSNIQDNCVLDEAFKPLGVDHDGSTIVGHFCTVWNTSTLFNLFRLDTIVF